MHCFFGKPDKNSYDKQNYASNEVLGNNPLNGIYFPQETKDATDILYCF